MNKILTLAITSLFCLLIPLEMLAKSKAYYDYARVVQVRPVYQSMSYRSPRTVCKNVKVYRGYSNSPTPALFGALIGGLVGNQFGSGDGKTAMTVAGAALGASIAYDNEQQARGYRHDYKHYQRRCYTVYDSHGYQKVTYYKVKYRYKGRNYVVKMPYRPGNKLRVRVSTTVTPIY